MFFLLASMIQACSIPNRGLFAGKTPHEHYADMLRKSGLSKTALGKSWFGASDSSLLRAHTIQLPYRETGYFDASLPEAVGYRFAARRGDKLAILISSVPDTGFTMFLDLWEPEANEKPRFLAAADTSGFRISYEVTRDGDYLVRLQPELLAGGEYTMTIRTGPSLDFPVATDATPRIGTQ